MKDSLLPRYWFRTKGGLGLGVTAYSIEDAETLINDAVRQLSCSYEVSEIIEDSDVRELDQNHVIPNMGTAIIAVVEKSTQLP